MDELDALNVAIAKGIRYGLASCKVDHDDIEWMSLKIEVAIWREIMKNSTQFFFGEVLKTLDSITEKLMGGKNNG